MLKLPADQIVALPTDQVALLVLQDLIATKQWNEYNYLLGVGREIGGGAAAVASEALAWLRGKALIARTPDQSSDAAIFVTRTGQRVAREGLTQFLAAERLSGGVHHLIEAKVRPQFLLGEYELGVFAAMKTVEVRVRQLGGFGDDDIGVRLMNQAFGPNGPLTDPSAVAGEQDGTRALFVGAYAVLRNPAGHRDVNYDQVTEAAEAVHTASLLMRILDRVEQRMSAA